MVTIHSEQRKRVILDPLLLRSPVSQGLLVPFLGAGASSLRTDTGGSAHARTRETILRRYHGLRKVLDEERSRSYVRAVLEANGIAADDGAGADAVETPLIPIQRALVELGVALAGEMGESFRACERSPSQAIRGRIPIAPDAAIRVARAVADLLVALDRFPRDARQGAIRMLREGVMFSRITTLGCVLLGAERMRELGRDVHPKVEDLVESYLDFYGPRGPGFGIEQLEWLESFLWFTFRHDVPAYPTTGELAFQLSLLPKDPIIPVQGLPEIAEMTDYHELVDQITGLFRFYDEAHEPAAFPVHLSVARMLRHDFERKRARHRSDPRRWLSVAFTTNYDRALERALTHLHVDYHVVYPIIAEADARTNRVNIRWIMKTERAGAGASPSYTLLDKDDQEPPLDEKGQTVAFEGPVIVKLHGSPLDACAIQGPILSSGGRFERLPQETPPHHFIVLSESSYLDSVLDPRLLPEWLERHLKDGAKHLWFLGYSISDWNIRLRLYRYLNLNQEAGGRTSDRVAIGRRFDPERTPMLSNLKVQICEADLRRFAQILHGILNEEGAR